MPTLMKIEEVAEATGISVYTLRYWRATGRGDGPTSFKLGRRVMYRREDVEAWLRSEYDATSSRSAS